jgi:hypothetical protein
VRPRLCGAAAGTAEWLEQDEYDELAHRKHDLGPYARRICDSPEIVEVINPDWTPGKQKVD